MLTLSSPPRQKLPCFIYFFPAVWPVATSFLEGGGGGGGQRGRGEEWEGKARFLEQKSSTVSQKSPS